MASEISIIGLIAISLCWGLTNPFIRLGSHGIEYVTKKYESATVVRRSYEEFRFLATNLSYMVPLSVNLLGSIFYYRLLGHTSFNL